MFSRVISIADFGSAAWLVPFRYFPVCGWSVWSGVNSGGCGQHTLSGVASPRKGAFHFAGMAVS